MSSCFKPCGRAHLQNYPAILLLGLIAGQGLKAQTPDVTEDSLPDDISTEMQETSSNQDGRVFFDIDHWIEARQRFQKKTGLDWRISYDSLLLASIGGDGVPFGASGDFTFQGLWAIGHQWRDNPTELRFRFRNRHSYGGMDPPSAIGTEIGTLWGVVRGFNDNGFEIPDFYLRHTFVNPNLEIRYGQMKIDSQFGGHQLSSAKKSFLNRAFSANPAVAFPSFGAGLTALLKLDSGFSIGIGATTVQGSQEDQEIDLGFGSDNLFSTLQLAYDFKSPDELSRRVQFLAWHSDAVEDTMTPEGQGLSLTYEHELDSDGTRLFARMAWSDGAAAPANQFLAAGIRFPCKEHDYLGFAAGIGRGSNTDNDVQAVFETFYRWNPRKDLWITPDLQLLVGEGFNEGPGVRIVAGLRAGIRF